MNSISQRPFQDRFQIIFIVGSTSLLFILPEYLSKFWWCFSSSFEDQRRRFLLNPTVLLEIRGASSMLSYQIVSSHAILFHPSRVFQELLSLSIIRSIPVILVLFSRRLLKTEEEFFLSILSVLSKFRGSSFMLSSRIIPFVSYSFHPSGVFQELFSHFFITKAIIPVIVLYLPRCFVQVFFNQLIISWLVCF